MAASDLRRCAAEHRPALNEDGRIDCSILSSFDGRASVGDIARTVSEHFPHSFREREEALARVAKLSRKYSR